MNDNDYPGVKGEALTIVLNKDWLSNTELLIVNNMWVQVTSTPIKIDKWWMKILRFITFGKCDKSYWVYKITQVISKYGKDSSN